MVLTDIGVEVAERSEQILAAARDLVDFARHRSSVLTGRLTLGVIPTLAPYVLPRMLSTLQRRYPDLQVELRETQTRVLLEELARGQLDAVMLALAAQRARHRDPGAVSRIRSCSRCRRPTSGPTRRGCRRATSSTTA